MTGWGLAVLERLPLRGDERVLDAGCGTGQVTAALRDRLPGGEVIACSSEAGGVVTNGMSRYKRVSGFANSGLVVQTKEADFAGEAGPEVLRGQAFQRRTEQTAFDLGGRTYAAPAIRDRVSVDVGFSVDVLGLAD